MRRIVVSMLLALPMVMLFAETALAGATWK